jgi:hypothetical protein
MQARCARRDQQRDCDAGDPFPRRHHTLLCEGKQTFSQFKATRMPRITG